MDPAIDIRDLTVAFPTRDGVLRALDGVTLAVEPGRVFGFLGPNGAGKTTTMHVLLGFTDATSGQARVFGRDVRQSIARERIGYLPEHPDTYRFLTGRELLTMTGRLFMLGGRQLRQRVNAVLEGTKIADAADRRIATYSRGMMQRICLAQALVNDPDLVILDEPTSGLDPLGRMTIRGIIEDLRSRGKTVFFSSHELSEVELVCDHIAIMARGRIVADAPTNELIRTDETLERYFMRVVGSPPPNPSPPPRPAGGQPS
jgi:ABC-2 type transport system ATP-binding protein